MCKIRYIHRVKGLVESDQNVKIENKEFDLVDKPYYIVRDDEENSSLYSFHYLDINESRKSVVANCFTIQYGVETGRLLSLTVRLPLNGRVKYEQWASFRKQLLGDVNADISKKILESFDIVQRLYFEKYIKLDFNTATDNNSESRVSDGQVTSLC